jgi:hypothetical protein
VRDRIELSEGSGGTQGTTLRDTGLPAIAIGAGLVREGALVEISAVAVLRR